MAKLYGLPSLSEVKNWEDLRRFVVQWIDSCSSALTGNLTFSDNVRCTLILIGPNPTTTPNTYRWPASGALSVQHGLGPGYSGYIVMGQDGAGTMSEDTSFPLNRVTIYFRTTTPTTTFRVIILG